MRDIGTLRDHMFDAIEAVKEGKMTKEQAEMIRDFGQVIVNTAKVEVEHMRVTNSDGSGFIPEAPNVRRLPRGDANGSAELPQDKTARRLANQG